MQCNTSHSLVHSSSMAVRSCWILAGTRCCIRRSRASQKCSMGDMSGEYAGHARTGMFSAFQELCTDRCKHGAVHYQCCNMSWWSKMNGTTIGLRISSRYLCAFKWPSMSITFACPYHNSTATMGYSIHNVDISKPLTHATPYTLSAFCPVQWKPGFIREENTSPKCQSSSNVSICPLSRLWRRTVVRSRTPMRTTNMQMSFPEMVSDSLCRNSLVMQTDCCRSCPGGWSQTILEVKMLDVEVLDWCGCTWSAVVRLVGCTAKFSERPLKMAYGR